MLLFDVGTSAALCSVSTSTSALTNSFRNSALPVFGSIARNMVVSVLAVIWLLVAYSVPVAISRALSLLYTVAGN